MKNNTVNTNTMVEIIENVGIRPKRGISSQKASVLNTVFRGAWAALHNPPSPPKKTCSIERTGPPRKEKSVRKHSVTVQLWGPKPILNLQTRCEH